jgi:hypothetical protein
MTAEGRSGSVATKQATPRLSEETMLPNLYLMERIRAQDAQQRVKTKQETRIGIALAEQTDGS